MENKLNDILNITRIENITKTDFDLANKKWESIKTNASQAISRYIVCALDDAKERIGV